MAHTPRHNAATPSRLLAYQRRGLQNVPPQTPECFASVAVETPGPPPRKRSSKDDRDEVRNLKVAIRIRPLNTRELGYVGVTNALQTVDKRVKVNYSSTGAVSGTAMDYTFHYDHVFWSCSNEHPNYATQQDVFDTLGRPLLENAFRGYNACLFAYGQTGSGKSYSMMGPHEAGIDCRVDAGIIPRFCRTLFEKISGSSLSAAVEISYFEIYNEKIHDLLVSGDGGNRVPLKVREHPVWGPYVVNLHREAVTTYEELRHWLISGNNNRETAATAMNEKSSRSHSIFSVELSVSQEEEHGDTSKRSKVSLVDLAGSERWISHVGANDERIKQHVNINKSLLTLGKVICSLAEKDRRGQFVPYRESMLTWLLRESLGGNSLTSMLATVTPASNHVDETLSTLRYACQARAIVNRAHVNEELHDKLIRELRMEVERLRAEYQNSSSSCVLLNRSQEYCHELDELRSKMTEKEMELDAAQKMWEAKLREAREQQMQELAEAERRKEELEAHVRVLSNIDLNVKVSPLHSNFLQRLETVLERRSHSVDDLRDWLESHDFNYRVTENGSTINVSDPENKRFCRLPITKLGSIAFTEHPEQFLNALKWSDEDDDYSEDSAGTTMEKIFGEMEVLRRYTERDERTRLAYAKALKSLQALEACLPIRRPKKVCFRL